MSDKRMWSISWTTLQNRPECPHDLADHDVQTAGHLVRIDPMSENSSPFSDI